MVAKPVPPTLRGPLIWTFPAVTSPSSSRSGSNVTKNGHASRMLATIQGWIFPWPMVFQNGKARLRFAFLSLSRSIDDSSKRRSNVSWKSWKKRRRGDTAAPVVFSCCVRRIVKVSPPRWMKTGEIKGRTDGAVHCEEVLAARED